MATLDELLQSKQEALARKEAAGEDVSMWDPGAVYAGGEQVSSVEQYEDIISDPIRMASEKVRGTLGMLPEKQSGAEAGVSLGAVPSLAGLAGLLPGGIGGTLGTIAGAAGALWGGAQALGFGEGEGLFGLDVLGGDTQYRDGVPFGGPGLAEPPAAYVLKEWHVNYDWGRLQYYMVKMPGQSRKIAMYNTRTKKWKIWVFRTPRLAVIGKNMPSHKMITRLRRNLKKHTADARTILSMTSPAYVERRRRSLRQRRR